MSIIAAMQELADDIGARVDRPVTIDARNVGPLPAVLVEPPTLSTETSSLCGSIQARFPVYVIGPPGALAELRALDALLMQVADALDAAQVAWATATPLGYVPLNTTSSADPCQAYRIDVERLIPWPS